MNIALFKYYMAKNRETMSTLAVALGKCKATVSNCVNGNNNSEFNRADIQVLKERWKLTPEQVDKVFLHRRRTGSLSSALPAPGVTSTGTPPNHRKSYQPKAAAATNSKAPPQRRICPTERIKRATGIILCNGKNRR